MTITVIATAFVAAKIEEKETAQYFGDTYTDYMKRTKMFIPWLV